MAEQRGKLALARPPWRQWRAVLQRDARAVAIGLAVGAAVRAQRREGAVREALDDAAVRRRRAVLVAAVAAWAAARAEVLQAVVLPAAAVCGHARSLCAVARACVDPATATAAPPPGSSRRCAVRRRGGALTAEAEAMDGKGKRRGGTSTSSGYDVDARPQARARPPPPRANLAAEAALARRAAAPACTSSVAPGRRARTRSPRAARCARAPRSRAALTTLRKHAAACAARRHEPEVADGGARGARRVTVAAWAGMRARVRRGGRRRRSGSSRCEAPRCRARSDLRRVGHRAPDAPPCAPRATAASTPTASAVPQRPPAHTIRRRVRLQALRSAAPPPPPPRAAAAWLWRWRRRPPRRRRRRPPRRRAPRVASLPCVVGGWVRYHLRKRPRRHSCARPPRCTGGGCGRRAPRSGSRRPLAPR